MSTIMGVAPRIRIDGPLPRPALYGLTSVAQEMVDADSHWRAGANIRPYPPDLPNALDPCGDTSPEGTKATPETVGMPGTFPTFTAYLGEECTAGGIRDWDAWKERANVALKARVSYALERQLIDAEFISTYDTASGPADVPHLGDDDVVILTATSDFARAIGRLDNYLGENSAQDGVIHVTPTVVDHLGFQYFQNDRGILRTPRGTPVIVGNGYIGADVPTPEGSPADEPEGDQTWIYVTGPVLYRVDSEIQALPEEMSEALDRSTNNVVYRAEVDLWVGWDKQIQAAIMAGQD